MKRNYLLKLGAFSALGVGALLLIIFWWLFSVKPPAPESTPATKALSVKEAVKKIEAIDKIMILADAADKTSLAVDYIPQSLKAWEEFAGQFKNNQPVEFSKTRDWGKKILAALGYMQKADELRQENNYEAANREKDKARQILKNIKEDNGIIDRSGEFLELYQLGRKVAAQKTAESGKADLERLKLKFTAIKEYRQDQEYIKITDKLEKTIGQIDKLLPGPDMDAARRRLMPLINKLYMDY